MRLHPLGDRVLIAPTTRKTETASGIELVERYTPEFTGYVRAIGPKVKDLKLGDPVAFGLHAGQELWLEQTKFLMMRESDVIAVLEATV